MKPLTLSLPPTNRKPKLSDDIRSGLIQAGLQHRPAAPVVQTVDPEKETDEWIEFARRTKIISGTNLTSFEPYEHQIRLFRGMEQHRGNIVTKSRQIGVTEFGGSRALFKAAKNPAYTGCFFSLTGGDTTKIAERVQLMAASHPDLTLSKANTQAIQVAGAGRILFHTSTPQSGRGLPSVHEIYCDEWAHVALAKQIYGAAAPALEMLGEDARILMMSTPNGINPQQQFWETLNGHNDFDVLSLIQLMRDRKVDPIQQWTDNDGWHKMIVHWSAHPVYSKRTNYLIEVKRKNKIDEKTLQREYNLGFDESGSGDVILMEWFRDRRYDEPPIKPWRIVLSMDTAQSKKSGSSKWGFSIWAEWHMGHALTWAEEKRFGFIDGVSHAKALIATHRPTVVIIEGKSSGLDVVDVLMRDPEVSVPVLALGVPKSSAGDDPKVRRMSAETPQMEVGRVWLPRSAPWLGWVEQRFQSYPNPEPDETGDTSRDFEDTVSQYLRWVRENPIHQGVSPVAVGEARHIHSIMQKSSRAEVMNMSRYGR